MGLLPRSLQKIFGLTGATGEFGKIGSKAAGLPVTTKDLELMQELSQYALGLNAIVSDQGTSVLPFLEDINSLFFLTTSQIAYLFQAGIPEWNAETEYYLNISLVVEGGITYKDIFGTGGTPNLNFQPSTNPTKWERVLGLREVDFESKDLIITVPSVTIIKVNCERLSILDQSNIPTFIDDLDLTFTMPTDLEAGTSEKPSTHYVIWVDKDLNQILAPDLESTTDGTTAFKLVDSAATLLTDLVHAGDIAHNKRTNLKTTVSADATLEGEVSVVDDIFVSGDDYVIEKLSPIGLDDSRVRLGSVRNDSGSDFVSFEQEDKDITIPDTTALSSGSSSSIAEIDLSTVIPITAKKVTGRYFVDRTSVSVEFQLYADLAGVYQIARPIMTNVTSGAITIGGQYSAKLLNRQRLYYKTTATGSPSVNIFITGYSL